MKKICQKCRKEYTELENYCTKCGIELEKLGENKEKHKKEGGS